LAVNLLVGDTDGIDMAEFHQLIAVADLDIGEARIIVMLQGMAVDELIARELIRPAVVAAVHIAEEHDAVFVREGNRLRVQRTLWLRLACLAFALILP
jgi:hypothetical protein